MSSLVYGALPLGSRHPEEHQWGTEVHMRGSNGSQNSWGVHSAYWPSLTMNINWFFLLNPRGRKKLKEEKWFLLVHMRCKYIWNLHRTITKYVSESECNSCKVKCNFTYEETNNLNIGQFCNKKCSVTCYPGQCYDRKHLVSKVFNSNSFHSKFQYFKRIVNAIRDLHEQLDSRHILILVRTNSPSFQKCYDLLVMRINVIVPLR